VTRRYLAVFVVLMVVALVLAATTAGGLMVERVRIFMLFFMGVVALVGYTATVAAGLLCTDRLIVSIKGRIVFQAIHRTLAVIATASLITHITLQIMTKNATAIQAVVPIGGRRSCVVVHSGLTGASGVAPCHDFMINLGVVASDLMIIILATGVFRMKFVKRPRLWRLVHMSIYLAWPLALVHGLYAGRTGKPYVFVSYEACVVLVILALAARVLVQIKPRRRASKPRARVVDAKTPGKAVIVATPNDGNSVSDEEFWEFVRGGQK
jgi:hypothetical protein